MKLPTLSMLMIILVTKSLLIVGFILSGTVGLGPDEAQYWTWSKELDWGYYSKPPGIAWQIALGTLFLGDTELGVRIVSVILGFLLPIAVYFLARGCRLKEETAFFAGLAMAFSPLGILSSLLATTDGGMVLFWTLASIVMAAALSAGKTPNYYLLGLLILSGALFKWPIYLFWIFVFLFWIPFPHLRSIHVFGGLLLSLLGLFPSIIWNYTHDWATFQHVAATVVGGHGKETGTTPLPKGNFLEFLGAQISLLSPVLFGLFLASAVSMVRNLSKIWPSVLFCGGTALLLLSGYAGMSFFQKMQGNWCVFAYPAGIVLLSWFACERLSSGKPWLLGGIVLSIVLTFLILSIPFVQARGILNLPYAMSPFRHNVGWDRLSEELGKAGYDPEKHFLFGDKYQMTSLLSFYSPGQKRAYFLNLHGARKNQFSYWPGMGEEQPGGTGYFILAENEPQFTSKLEEMTTFYKETLGNYCENAEFLGVRPLFYNSSTPVKKAIIFKCLNYNGKEPSDPELY